MTAPFLAEISVAYDLNGAGQPTPALGILGEGSLPSWFAVTDLAVASMGFAGTMLAEYAALASGKASDVAVDRRLASLWYGFTIRPNGWELPPPWDPIAGDYRAKDGWIRLHTNAPHHRDAAFSVLGTHTDKASVARAVAAFDASDLEAAIVAANGCAAAMHALDEWKQHPHGSTVGSDPLVIWERHGPVDGPQQSVAAGRPLQGLRVLDLTRVLAGPVAGRFLAAYGAEVLRIDPPDWDEPAVVPEVTLGKKCAQLELRKPDDLETFRGLVRDADLLLHGYRPGALDGLGLGGNVLRELNPRLIDVSLNAYGWSGPWSQRRGFDSLVQMSSGIADHGMRQSGAEMPVPLPVQAVDHTTGYLMAAAAIKALTQRQLSGAVYSARLSLARTAQVLAGAKSNAAGAEFRPLSEDDLGDAIENTVWGPANRVRFPLHIDGIAAHWDHPACDLRSQQPEWDMV